MLPDLPQGTEGVYSTENDAVRCAFGLCSNGCLVALVVGFHIAPLCAEACAARSRRAVVRLLVGLDAHFARADLSPEARGLNGVYEAWKGNNGIERSGKESCRARGGE